MLLVTVVMVQLLESDTNVRFALTLIIAKNVKPMFSILILSWKSRA